MAESDQIHRRGEDTLPGAPPGSPSSVDETMPLHLSAADDTPGEPLGAGSRPWASSDAVTSDFARQEHTTSLPLLSLPRQRDQRKRTVLYGLAGAALLALGLWGVVGGSPLGADAANASPKVIATQAPESLLASAPSPTREATATSAPSPTVPLLGDPTATLAIPTATLSPTPDPTLPPATATSVPTATPAQGIRSVAPPSVGQAGGTGGGQKAEARPAQKQESPKPAKADKPTKPSKPDQGKGHGKKG